MGDEHVPVWDNPHGQLPGSGIPTGIDSGLYGFSHQEREKSSVVERAALALERNEDFDPCAGSATDPPKHTLVVEDFHKHHNTNDYTQYLLEGNGMPFEAWYSTKVEGIVTSTMQIAEANGWDFNPVYYQDGHDGRVVKWSAATNELYVRMTKPTAAGGDFSPEDLRLVLRAILTVSGPWDNSEGNRPVMTTDEIMSEMAKAPQEVLLKLIRDLTMP